LGWLTDGVCYVPEPLNPVRMEGQNPSEERTEDIAKLHVLKEKHLIVKEGIRRK
jgi:hypothetical protein